MQSSDEYSDQHDDPSDDDYDPRPSSSLSTPTRRKTSPTKRTSPAKAGAQAPMEPMKRTLSLYSLPAEIIDAILYEPTLRIHDHMALARTCRTLRAVYYTPPPAGKTYAAFSSPVWAALVAQHPFEGQGRPALVYGYSYNATAMAGMYPCDEKEKRLKHLWSDRFDETKMLVLGSKRTPERRKWDRALQMHVIHPAKHEKMLIRSEEWTDAITDVAKQRITKTTAKQNYKLSEAELGRLPHVEKRNPHYRNAAPMQLYVEAAVERLAYKLHGGYQGHLALLKSLAARAAKAEQTRRAKAAGTWRPPTPQKTPKKSRKAQEEEPMPTPGWRQLTPPPIVLGDDDDDEAGSPTPGPSRAAAVAAPGPVFISDNENDNDNDDELMLMEPKTPTRRPKKRAFQDEDEDDAIIFATPPPLPQQRQQPQQQLPTPLSPLGRVDPLSMVGASTPSPSARKKHRARRRPQPLLSASSVKQETDPVGGTPTAYKDSLFGLGKAQGEDDEVKPSPGTLQVAEASGSTAGPAQTLPKFEGLAWLSPWSEEAAVGGGGVPVKQDAQGQGDVKKEEEEVTIRRNDGRPARRGARRDYSIYA